MISNLNFYTHPRVMLQSNNIAYVSYHEGWGTPSDPLAALEKLRVAAEIKFCEREHPTLPALIEDLHERASKINFWTNFWDSIGKALFSCLGYKTTAQKVDEVYEALKGKYKTDAEAEQEVEQKKKPEAEEKPIEAKQEADNKAEDAKPVVEEKVAEIKPEVNQEANEADKPQEAKDGVESLDQLRQARIKRFDKTLEKQELDARRHAARAEFIKAKFSRQPLYLIGLDAKEIKRFIDQVEDELKKEDVKVKEKVYLYLSTLNHYKIAKHFAGLAHVTLDNVDPLIKAFKAHIQNQKFDEAQKVIDTIRFVDLKAFLRAKLQGAKEIKR